MTNYPIHIGSEALAYLPNLLEAEKASQVVVLIDTHTRKWCYPRLKPHLPAHVCIEIMPGETHKNLETCQLIWEQMTQLQLDRKAVVINLGGGVIGDMGGFVAQTYKRGIGFIQVPTTLLSQVDASVGGKLGIDFKGYKNHIGMFADPIAVLIEPTFLATLPPAELRSGLAEVIKHHLIADRSGWESLRQTRPLASPTSTDWGALIAHSVGVKAQIVQQDVTEQGIRKALNFGHTLGHAIEGHRLAEGNPMLHGDAVAIGMIMESWLSWQKGFLSAEAFTEIQTYLSEIYPTPPVPAESFSAIYQRTLNDKKNVGGVINCTLLNEVGQVRVNEPISQSEVLESLEAYNRLVLTQA